jgi:hypothetical protein
VLDQVEGLTAKAKAASAMARKWPMIGMFVAELDMEPGIGMERDEPD